MTTVDQKAAAAVATLEGKGYTYAGGQLWQPPMGKMPNFDLVDYWRGRAARLCVERAKGWEKCGLSCDSTEAMMRQAAKNEALALASQIRDEVCFFSANDQNCGNQQTMIGIANKLADEQIIDIRKQASGGRFGRPATTPWGDTLKFARALLAAAQSTTDNPAASHWHGLYLQAVRQKHDDVARLGAQIVALEGELEGVKRWMMAASVALVAADLCIDAITDSPLDAPERAPMIESTRGTIAMVLKGVA